MRIRTNRIYPYPIFCCDSKDYENKHFESSVDIEYDMVDATVLLNLVIEDEMIQELIKQKKVAVNCMVDCSRTKYREVFEIGMDEQLHAEIVIPVERLNGLIEITCLLVTNVKIENVENDNFAGLYDNAVVSYPQYATIGYTETEELELNKHIDSSGEIPSIFKITRGADDSKEISYDASDVYINIYLPPEQYKIYMDYKGVSKRLKTMMLNLPVLAEILCSINEGNNDYASFAWFDVIDLALQKQGYTPLGKDFTTRPAVEVAQNLLGALVKDAFDEFDRLNRDK